MTQSASRNLPQVQQCDEAVFPVDSSIQSDGREIPAPKRRKPSTASTSGVIPLRRRSSTQSGASIRDTSTGSVPVPPLDKEGSTGPETTLPVKSKRVRTGCLTCRERHLKCDEATPDCMNCRKSNRECKRGVRLNFIDVQVRDHPMLPPTADWAVQFQDESRLIAGEYQGGLSRYPSEPKPSSDNDSRTITTISSSIASCKIEGSHSGSLQGSPSQHDPSVISPLSLATRWLSTDDSTPYHARKSSDSSTVVSEIVHPRHTSYSIPLKKFASSADSVYRASDASSVSSLHLHNTVAPSIVVASGGTLSPEGAPSPPVVTENAITGEREYLNSPEDLLFMQVFVHEVAIWMDSLDESRHFSHIIPYLALKWPMLLNACLACGAMHLTLVNPSYSQTKALSYYNTATTQLLRSLQNPERDPAESATTAVVLNVYEIMFGEPTQTTTHVVGARALIRECKWNAQSTGVGSACFWLNVKMEVLDSLLSNYKLSWDPDQWGVDMGFTVPKTSSLQSTTATTMGGPKSEEEKNAARQHVKDLVNIGNEEVWVHRILYIVAKIANFRVGLINQEDNLQNEQLHIGTNLKKWHELKKICDNWNLASPQTFRPLGYLYTSQTSTLSAFPEVW
ncbi:hypothetical protein Cpir12675_006987 [Ceratocystis pirilliformis]|uniref:Zn(2)-C6 fungal-type domain-containing protein n=1 Tax=Ceratocystis pirilliformis TaxID=259994 RepID=A0ABR3YB96_9PEZI